MRRPSPSKSCRPSRACCSHDHYDHLTTPPSSNWPQQEHFVTPLGVGDRLIAWGVPAAKVQQFDWWQGTTVGGLQLAATPAQHFGPQPVGRQPHVWASWVLDCR